jgi:hypothetical protein
VVYNWNSFAEESLTVSHTAGLPEVDPSAVFHVLNVVWRWQECFVLKQVVVFLICDSQWIGTLKTLVIFFASW